MQENIHKEEQILDSIQNLESNSKLEPETVSSEAVQIEETESIQTDTVSEQSEQDELLLKMQQLEKELLETKDQLVRLAADFDNYKKRTLKEKADIVTYANEDLIKSILPILDDFDRTMKVVHTSDNLEAIKEGLELVAKNLFHQLSKKGVEQIPALNEEFNSELHEAIGSLPVEDESKKNKIIEVVEEGYKYQGKVIRHSKVIIGV